MMCERENLSTLAKARSRRQVIASVAMGFGSLAAGSRVWGQGQQPPKKDVPINPDNGTRTSLHQEVSFKATPQRIYEALLDGKQFAAITGLAAEIDPKAGGAFSMFGGLIVGRNVELIPNARIVQAWRPTHWDAGVYSIVRFALRPQNSETQLVLDHTGFPEGEFDNLNTGWKPRYWEPLRKALA